MHRFALLVHFALGLLTTSAAALDEVRERPAARTNPTYVDELDALLGPPSEPPLDSLLDACRASRRHFRPGPPGPHRHRLEASPAATVFFGDVCLGRTPLTVRPPRGERWRVEIRRAGYRPQHRMLPLRSTEQHIRLTAPPPPREPLIGTTHDPF